jgi:hypothetical protein
MKSIIMLLLFTSSLTSSAFYYGDNEGWYDEPSMCEEKAKEVNKTCYSYDREVSYREMSDCAERLMLDESYFYPNDIYFDQGKVFCRDLE